MTNWAAEGIRVTVPDPVAALVAELPSAVVRATWTMHDRGLVVSSLGNVSARHEVGLIITPTAGPIGYSTLLTLSISVLMDRSGQERESPLWGVFGARRRVHELASRPSCPAFTGRSG